MRKILLTLIGLNLGLLATDAIPSLRGGAGWQWPYVKPTDWTPVAILAGLLVIYVAGAIILRRSQHRAWPSLLWGLMGMVVLTLSTLTIQQDDPFFLLFTRTASPVQTGASTIAVRSMAENGVHETLVNWPTVMEEAKAPDINIIHFTTHPPGQALVHYWAAQPLDDASFLQSLQMDLRHYQCDNEQVMQATRGEILSIGVVGMLMPLWAALAIFPLYFTVKLLTDDTPQAIRLAQWWALVPSILLFTPTWNTLYPLLCITAFYGLLRGVMRGQWGYTLVAGLVLGLNTGLTFTILPIGLLFGLYIVGYWWWFMRPTAKVKIDWAVKHLLLLGLGVIIPWLIFWLYSGTTPFEIFSAGIRNHRDLVQRADYVVWIFLHLYDLFLFAGWALVALSIWGMVRAFQRWRQADITPLSLLGLVLAVTLVIIALSGTAQGETARLLTFYSPFLIVVMALVLDNNRFDLPFMGLQALTVLVLASFVPVIPLDLNMPPATPRQDVPSFDHLALIDPSATFASSRFEGKFELEGYRYIADVTNQVITFEFHWRGNQPTERPYQFQLVGYANNSIDGDIVTEPFVWLPQSGNYLSTCWQAGDLVRDVVIMPLPTIAEPVKWTVTLQAIDGRTGDTLPAEPVMIGPINYP